MWRSCVDRPHRRSSLEMAAVERSNTVDAIGYSPQQTDRPKVSTIKLNGTRHAVRMRLGPHNDRKSGGNHISWLPRADRRQIDPTFVASYLRNNDTMTPRTSYVVDDDLTTVSRCPLLVAITNLPVGLIISAVPDLCPTLRNRSVTY